MQYVKKLSLPLSALKKCTKKSDRIHQQMCEKCSCSCTQIKCKHQKNCHLLFSSPCCMQKVQNIQKLSSSLFLHTKKVQNAKNYHFLFSQMFYLHTKSAKKCQKLSSSLLFSCLPVKCAKCKSWKNFIYLLFAHKKCKTCQNCLLLLFFFLICT